MKLTVYEKTPEDMACYLQQCVIPELKQGYKSGHITCGVSWDITGDPALESIVRSAIDINCKECSEYPKKISESACMCDPVYEVILEQLVHTNHTEDDAAAMFDKLHDQDAS